MKRNASIRSGQVVVGPVEVLECDIQQVLAKLQKQRGKGGKRVCDFSSYLNELICLVPDRVGEFIELADWDILDTETSSYAYGEPDSRCFLKPNDFLVLQPLNPTLVNRWLAEDEERFWPAIELAIQDVRNGEYCEHSEDATEEDILHELTFGLAFHIARAARFDKERALTYLDSKDWEAIHAALEWNEKGYGWHSVNYIHAVWSFAPELGLKHLHAIWPKAKASLVKWRKFSHRTIKELLRRKLSMTNGFEDYYFHAMEQVFAMCPELAEEVTLEADWKLLQEELTYWRARRDPLYWVSHLCYMREWEPMYKRFFRK